MVNKVLKYKIFLVQFLLRMSIATRPTQLSSTILSQQREVNKFPQYKIFSGQFLLEMSITTKPPQ